MTEGLLREIIAKLDAVLEAVKVPKEPPDKQRNPYGGDPLWDERTEALVRGIVKNGLVGTLEASNTPELQEISARSRLKQEYTRQFKRKFESSDERYSLHYFEMRTADNRTTFGFVTFVGYVHEAVGLALDRVYGPGVAEATEGGYGGTIERRARLRERAAREVLKNLYTDESDEIQARADCVICGMAGRVELTALQATFRNALNSSSVPTFARGPWPPFEAIESADEVWATFKRTWWGEWKPGRPPAKPVTIVVAEPRASGGEALSDVPDL